MSDRLYGGFWRRLLAYVIDEVILYLISLLFFLIGAIALALGGVPFANILATGDLPHGMRLFVLVYAVMTFLSGMAYFTWFHGAVGQTPGKMLLRIRVIQVTGDPMTFGIAFLRWTGSLVSSLVLWLGFLWIAFDRRKQGWHDKIAATLVVSVERETSTASRASVHRESEPVAYALTEDAPFPVDTRQRPEDGTGCTQTNVAHHLPCPPEARPGDCSGAATPPPPLIVTISASDSTEGPRTECEGVIAPDTPEKCLDKKGYIV